MSQPTNLPTPPSVHSGTVFRDDLVRYLDDYLGAHQGKDFCPNGLQVEGRREVRKVVVAVSACRELFERATGAGADAVVVHHGLFWAKASLRLVGVQYGRVKTLLDSGANLLAYHLPLDRHLELGNNGVAGRRLGLEEITPFGWYDGHSVGIRGRFSEPIAAEELFSRCRQLYGGEPVVFDHGPAEIRTAAVISGASQDYVHDAIAQGLDAFITGEATEWVMNLTRESGIHYLACGHYATERLGVQAVGEHLQTVLGLEVEFIDIPNPV